jgi:subtilisin-like proprotein convertase family protein
MAQETTLVTVEAKAVIPDFVENTSNPLVIFIPVSGMDKRIDEIYGLEKVSLSIKHAYISDLRIDLISPDGTLIWLSNRTGRDGADYENAKFSQNGFFGPIKDAKAPFKGDYVPDGSLDYFNNGQNPNGIWKLKIHDFNPSVEGVFEKVCLQFSKNPARKKATPCSFINPEKCKCSSEAVGWELLPDLVISQRSTMTNMWEVGYDASKGMGGLKFEVNTMNIGLGPLEVEGLGYWLCGKDTVEHSILCPDSSYSRQVFRQNIYTLKDGKLEKIYRDAGTMAYDAGTGHDHFHADNYANYSLLEKIEGEPNPAKWRVVGRSTKASFCLWDMRFCSSDLANCDDPAGKLYDEYNLLNYGLGKFKTCDDPHIQGLSVGGIDYYGLNYEGQTIEIPSGICNGIYYLWIVIDPLNKFKESDKTNNELLLPVRLRLQKSCDN